MVFHSSLPHFPNLQISEDPDDKKTKKKNQILTSFSLNYSSTFVFLTLKTFSGHCPIRAAPPCKRLLFVH